jgi:hypothetical protein
MNRRNKVDACDEMGGMEGAVSLMMATMDLGNATHVDLDSSVGIYPLSHTEQVQNWHFNAERLGMVSGHWLCPAWDHQGDEGWFGTTRVTRNAGR